MPTKPTHVPVSERALLARINRRLAAKGQAVKKCREQSRWHKDLGSHYLVDVRANLIAATDVDLGDTAKELGLLKPYEQSDTNWQHAPKGSRAVKSMASSRLAGATVKGQS